MNVCTPEFPNSRIRYLLEKVDLRSEDLEMLRAYREVFAKHGENFGEHFYEYFHAIPETRLILDQEPIPRRMAKTLGNWFAGFFLKEMNGEFLNSLWRSGLRHVQVNLDQRFVNLGYAVARQYCQTVAHNELPAADRFPASQVFNKMLDFCVLAATDSFVNCSSRCDQEVIAGIAHQVRNPITVIGGNLRRLQRQVDKDSPIFRTYEVLLEENHRLEKMVRDIAAYAELFRSEPLPAAVDLRDALEEVLTKLKASPWWKNVSVEVDLDQDCAVLMVDRRDLVTLLFYLLENSLEVADPQNPVVRVSSEPGQLPYSVNIYIFNSGRAPAGESVEDKFGPFKSTVPLGTGLGLSIARLATHRNMGWLVLEPIPDLGARYVIQLPKIKNG